MSAHPRESLWSELEAFTAARWPRFGARFKSCRVCQQGATELDRLLLALNAAFVLGLSSGLLLRPEAFAGGVR